MEENKQRYDLASTGFGAFVGVVIGTTAAVAAGVAGASVAGAAAVAAGVAAGGVVVRSNPKPRNFIMGGITSLVFYSAILLASEIGYSKGIETKLIPFSVEQDQGIVVQRRDGSQIPYILKDGAYVPFEDLSRGDLSSKIEEGQKTVTGLEGIYQARRNAILESIKDKQR